MSFFKLSSVATFKIRIVHCYRQDKVHSLDQIKQEVEIITPRKHLANCFPNLLV